MLIVGSSQNGCATQQNVIEIHTTYCIQKSPVSSGFSATSTRVSPGDSDDLRLVIANEVKDKKG